MTTISNAASWQRFQKYYTEYPDLGLAIDLSRMNFADSFLTEMEPRLQQAIEEMRKLEQGAIANPDEGRKVGHYWLRNPALAPEPVLRQEIETTLRDIKRFAAAVRSGQIRGGHGLFKHLLVIGIGGSALGPQFVAHALGNPAKDKLQVHFFDNTDPDGIDKVLLPLRKKLGRTLCLVISKSGGTKETRNGMLEAKEAYRAANLEFERHAVAITGVNSALDRIAVETHWIQRFPMWDWVGGRTSETSAVGLLPAALQGIAIDELLKGARACDEITRSDNVKANPAAQLALMWFYAGNGKGTKDMVILPYKDRLELFSRYLQQLIMESLGKEFDRGQQRVNQGIAVYGNKGSTDQHAYIQQLRDGIHNFFVTFIEVLRDRDSASMKVETGITTGDYLQGFFMGTRQALHEKGRESITLTIRDVSPFSVGVLIALYERAVGFYASLVNINAYHQPGVEAGKKAAGLVIDLQLKALDYLSRQPGQAFSVAQIAEGIGAVESSEPIFKVLERLSLNPDRQVVKHPGSTPFSATYELRGQS
jgi:glucose-6-phosphate isomerase